MEPSNYKNTTVRMVIMNGIVMALYIVLTLLVAPLSSGAIQVRISESLNHIVVFNRKFMWGIVGGVIIHNLFFGFGVLDAFYGGLQTFLALSLTALLQKKVKNVFLLLTLNTLFFTVSMALIAFMLVQADGGAFWGMYATLAPSEAITMAISAPIMYLVNEAVGLDKKI